MITTVESQLLIPSSPTLPPYSHAHRVMAPSPPASPGGSNHKPPNVTIDVPPDPPAHPPPTRLPSPALPDPLFPAGDSPPPSALPISSPSPDSDCFDEARLYEFLTPQPQTISRSRTIFMPRMSHRESVLLATPYGPDAPMTLSSVPFSELIEYNYSFIPSIGQSWKKMAGRLQARLHLPYLPWWGNRGCAYLKQDVWHDALAGLTCAVLVIPESLSYMVLASLAPVVGLYTAAVSPFAYALLGTSPHVSVGPISLVSLYLPSVFKSLGYPVEDRTAEGKQLRREVASVVAFYVFVTFAVMSFFRLGGLIRFLSHSVMAGFVCASGLFVAIKELKHILDLRPPESTFTHNYQVIFWLVTHLNETDLTSLALGGSALFVLLTVKYLKRRFPATPQRLQSRPFLVWYYVSSFSTLIIVLIGQVIAQALSKRGSSLHVLGSLPSGLSLPSPPLLSQFPAGRMLAQALPIAILAYVEAVSIAKKYSAVYGYKLDLNQDLAGYSLANLLSCMWGGVTPSGSFARTALSAEVGARTSFANIFTGSCVIICLYNTEILYHIPYCVLGALVESAMMNLISFHEFYHALRIARTSGLIMVFTFLVTLLWSVEDGLLYGIMASLALLLYQLSDVDTVMMGREPTHLDPDDKFTNRQRAGDQSASHLVSLRDNPRAIPCDPSGGIVVLRPVASLFFGNAECLVERMEALLQEVETELENGGEGHGANAVENPAAVAVVVAGEYDNSEAAIQNDVQPGSSSGVTRFILLDVSGIRLLDLPALAALREVVDVAAAKGTQVILSNGSKKLKASLQACGLWRRVGGPLVMHSTEEVFALLNNAPSLLPTLSAEASSYRLPREVGNGVVGKEEGEDEE